MNTIYLTQQYLLFSVGIHEVILCMCLKSHVKLKNISNRLLISKRHFHILFSFFVSILFSLSVCLFLHFFFHSIYSLSICLCAYVRLCMYQTRDQSQSIRHFHTFSCKFSLGILSWIWNLFITKFPLKHAINCKALPTHCWIYCDPKKKIQNPFMVYFVILNFVFSSKLNIFYIDNTAKCVRYHVRCTNELFTQICMFIIWKCFNFMWEL